MRLMQTAPDALSADLAAQVDTLLQVCFGQTAPYDYGPDRAELLLPLREGRVVGHLAAYRRAIRIGDETERVAMIGGVAIDPAERGRGHVRTMLADCHARFAAEGLPFSILFAFIPAVYRSSGYREMTNTTRFLDHDGGWKELVFRGGMVAALGSRRWPDLPIDLHGPAV
jgi:predicted GNAT family N-acyltransferase